MSALEEYGAKVEDICNSNQAIFEKLIRDRAEIDILLSRLHREKSDVDIRIKVLEKIIADHEAEEAIKIIKNIPDGRATP